MSKNNQAGQARKEASAKQKKGIKKKPARVVKPDATAKYEGGDLARVPKFPKDGGNHEGTCFKVGCFYVVVKSKIGRALREKSNENTETSRTSRLMINRINLL